MPSKRSLLIVFPIHSIVVVSINYSWSRETSNHHPLLSLSEKMADHESCESRAELSKIGSLLRNNDIKFVRLTWCDTAGVVRAKANHIRLFENIATDGFGLCTGVEVCKRKGDTYFVYSNRSKVETDSSIILYV